MLKVTRTRSGERGGRGGSVQRDMLGVCIRVRFSSGCGKIYGASIVRVYVL